MTQKDKYHEDWLKSNEDLLAIEKQDELRVYIENNPEEYSRWVFMESRIQMLKELEYNVPVEFEYNVLLKMKVIELSTPNTQLGRIAFVSAIAMVALMLNLVISQGTFSIDAFLGITDMVVEDTNLIFYVN